MKLYFVMFSVTEEKNIEGIFQSKQLQAAFRGKAAVDEIMVILKDMPNPLEDDEMPATHNPLAIEIFTQTLLMLGSKTLTHAYAAISKYTPVFKVRLY